MALFKIFRGPEDELATVPCHEGYAYFTEDLGNLYIDISDETPQGRVQVNAYFAEELRKISEDGDDVQYIKFDDIALKSAIWDVEHGGTGRTTLTVNAVLVGNGTDDIKMIEVGENQLITGDATDGIKGIDGTGFLYKTTNNAPQFLSAANARNTLEVYSKTETDNKIAAATTMAYTTTLAVAGWESSGDQYVYHYKNADLKCGSAGDVPPIVTYVTNLEEYSKIDKATATPGDGIDFYTSEQPKQAIEIIIIDNK